jgi:hypothetical protein
MVNLEDLGLRYYDLGLQSTSFWWNQHKNPIMKVTFARTGTKIKTLILHTSSPIF